MIGQPPASIWRLSSRSSDADSSSAENHAAQQRDDGGWPVTWAIWLPAIEFEWSGLVTISALKILRAYGAI